MKSPYGDGRLAEVECAAAASFFSTHHRQEISAFDVKNSLPCGGKIILTHSVDHIIVAGGESGLHRSMRQSGDVEFDKSFYMTETGKEQVRERIVGQTLGIWPCNRVKVGSCRRGEREDGLE